MLLNSQWNAEIEENAVSCQWCIISDECYENINDCHFFTDEVMVMIKRAEVQQQSYGEDGKKGGREGCECQD